MVSSGCHSLLFSINKHCAGCINRMQDCVIAQAVNGFPPRKPEFEPGSGQVEFVVDHVVLGQVFSK
jgi:hypothetical protein